MTDFLATLRGGRVLLMDGAMGTQLRVQGARPDECLELWNLTHPERVRSVHQAYADAGAQCLLTHTFQAHAQALRRFGLDGRCAEILHAAAALARAVAGPERFVLADVGPQPALAELPALVDGFGDLVDGFLLETFYDWQALAFAESMVQAARGKPVLLSLTYRRDPETRLVTAFDGTAPEAFAREAGSAGFAALGVNCGRDLGLAEVCDVVRRYRTATTLPLLARPNAGTPVRVGERWEYALTAAQLASWLPEVIAAGATLVGGCCGTTPGQVAVLRVSIMESGVANSPTVLSRNRHK